MYINYKGYHKKPGGALSLETVYGKTSVQDLGNISITIGDRNYLTSFKENFVLAPKETVSFVFSYLLIIKDAFPPINSLDWEEMKLIVKLQSASFSKEVIREISLNDSSEN